MRKRLGRTGFICLGLILALALCGVGYAHWGDTVTIEGTINTGEWNCGGTIGFWKNWDKHNTFTQEEIEGWLGAINATSDWLGPTMVEEMGDMLRYNCKSNMECKFLKQYLATRLNVESGLLDPEGTHNFATLDPDDYLGLGGSGKLSQIILAIEGKYPPDPNNSSVVWPTHDEYEIMKNLCDTLNNTGGIYPRVSP